LETIGWTLAPLKAFDRPSNISRYDSVKADLQGDGTWMKMGGEWKLIAGHSSAAAK
jgi:hypothetical protein